MTDIMLEIDEAMRKERLEKLWKNYGPFLLGVVFIIILGTGLLSAYKGWTQSVRTRDTDRLMELLQASDFPANINPDTLKLHAPLKGIALVNASEGYLKQNKISDALSMLEAAGQRSIPENIRQQATLMRVRIQTADPSRKELEKDLEPIINDRDSPWRYHASLEAASLAANRSHDYPKALTYLQEVEKEKNLPESLRLKAIALREIYASRHNQRQTDSDKD